MTKHKKGFTLIEVILYVAISAAVLVAFIQFILTMTQIKNKNTVVQEVQANGRIFLEVLGNMTRESDRIVLASSTFSMHPGILVLEMNSSTISPTVFSLDTQTGALLLKQGNLPTTTLSSQVVRVSRFVLTNTTGQSQRPNVRVQLTVESAVDSSQDVFFSQDLTTVLAER